MSRTTPSKPRKKRAPIRRWTRADERAAQAEIQRRERAGWAAIPDGTVGACMRQAVLRVNERLKTLKRGRTLQQDVVRCCARNAFQLALDIAKATRQGESLNASAFVNAQVHLEEWINRLDKLPRKSLDTWPSTPVTKFAGRAYPSALSAACGFARNVWHTTRFGMGMAGISFSYGMYRGALIPCVALRECSSERTDVAIGRWRAATLEELASKSLPAPPAWAMPTIHEEAGTIGVVLEDEYQRATHRGKRAAQTILVVQSEPQTPAAASRRDGVYNRATIVFAGKEYRIRLTERESQFLEYALTKPVSEVHPLFNRTNVILWSDFYNKESDEQRKRLLKLLHQVKGKILKPLRIRFRLQWRDGIIVREDGVDIDKDEPMRPEAPITKQLQAG